MFACREQVRKVKRMAFFPVPFMAYFGYCLGHNIFIAHAFFKSVMWAIPLVFVSGFRMNIKQNAQSLIDTIHLLENGTQVEIKNVYG